MTKKRNNSRISTFGAKRGRLACLFKLGSPDRAGSQDPELCTDIAEILASYLASPLPLDATWRKRLPTGLADLCHTSTMLSGGTIRSLLQDPQTDIVLIQSLKRYTKDLSQKTKNKADHDAITTLYFAAIAHALIHHGILITKYSYSELAERFHSLSESDWVTVELAELFRQSGIICRQHQESL